MGRVVRTAGVLALLAVATAACSGDDRLVVERSADAAPAATTVPSAPSTTNAPATTAATTTAVPTTTSTPTTTSAPPVERIVTDTGFAPLATAGPLTVVHPAARVERVGFHESGHDGARQMTPAPSATRPVTLESRERGTGSRTAADIVVPPDEEIRAPVTGTVKRAGGYVLYCEYQDDYAVIEPDARPGWEVKIFHIDGVRVRAGDRVEAGVTVVAPGPTLLPFESQVDERTAEPSWPHVHVEIVDPSIPDRPSPGGGCS